MIRAVLDANVLASAAAGNPSRAPATILRRWTFGSFVLVISPAILGEVERTLDKPYFRAKTSPFDRRSLVALLRDAAELVEPAVRVDGVATYPEDDRVLEAAVSAGVDYLVSGDRGLQRLGAFRGIPILDPRAFQAILDAEPA